MIDDNGQVKGSILDWRSNSVRIIWPVQNPKRNTPFYGDSKWCCAGDAGVSFAGAGGGRCVLRSSDLFAVGTLLYDAITGRTPFAGSKLHRDRGKRASRRAPPPSKFNRMVPRELNFIVAKATRKETNKRYQSAKELIADLSAVKERLEEESGRHLSRELAATLSDTAER